METKTFEEELEVIQQNLVRVSVTAAEATKALQELMDKWHKLEYCPHCKQDFIRPDKLEMKTVIVANEEAYCPPNKDCPYIHGYYIVDDLVCPECGKHVKFYNWQTLTEFTKEIYKSPEQGSEQAEE